MAVIIFGVREYGRVEDHGGEYAVTRFFHLWFAPLFPTGSSWISGADPSGRTGHDISLHGTSVAAGYLRVWGPIIAIGNLAAGLQSLSAAHLVVAAIAVGLTALSWTWRSLRTDAARRRSDFNFVAFGTRCEPKRMSRALRADLKRDLDHRWDARTPDRSPNDVALHGAADPDEAVIAYGLLRLAGLKRSPAAHGDADRILAGAHVPVAAVDGPYRATGATTNAPTAATLSDLVAERAQQLAAARPGSIRTADELTRDWKHRRRRWRLGLAAASLFVFGGVGMIGLAMQPTLTIGLRELRSVEPPTARTVRITCDAVHGPVWEETDSRGNTTSQIAMCELGKYLLPLKLDDDDALPQAGVLLQGELSTISEHHVWVKDGLRMEPDLEMRSVDVYLDMSHGDERPFQLALGIAMVIGAPLLYFLYFRARRRYRAELAKLTS